MSWNDIGNSSGPVSSPLMLHPGLRSAFDTRQRLRSHIRYSILCFHRVSFKEWFYALAAAFTKTLCQFFHWYWYANTALHYSVLYRREIKPEYLNRNLIDKVNCYGETALMLASRVDNLPLVKRLVDSKADIQITDHKGKNALHHAAETLKTVDIAKYLIESGLNPCSLDREGNSGVHLSSRSGSIEMLKFFHAQKAPLDEYNLKGYTPLMLAALNRRIEHVQFLVLQGADMAKRSHSTTISAFECALKGCGPKIIDLFIQRGVKSAGRVPIAAKSKNAATLLFEKMLGNIDKVEFKHIYDERGWNKIVVKMDQIACPLLDIFKEVKWETIHLSDQHYQTRIKRLGGADLTLMQNIDVHLERQMNIRLSPERPEDHAEIRGEYKEKYKNLNDFDKYILFKATGILNRHMNEVLAGVKKPSPEVNLGMLLMDIGLVANALNKIEPERVEQFTSRGQADIYKDNRHNAPMFVSLTRSYDVSKLYVSHGQIIRIEGSSRGHIVFFKEAVGFDLSGLSSVPIAEELITLPSVITYTDECFTYSPYSGVHPYYFGKLDKTVSFSAAL